MQKPLKNNQRHKHKDEPEEAGELGHKLVCRCERSEAISCLRVTFQTMSLPYLSGDCSPALAVPGSADVTLPHCGFRDRNELIGLEACTSHQRAVNIGKGEEFSSIRSSHGAAV